MTDASENTQITTRRPGLAPVVFTILLCSLHTWAIWLALEGRAGLTNGWPLWRDDHPLYYHSALVTRHFLQATHTTAGYDPAFMSGYAKSVVFPASSTLPELVVALFGGARPEFAYKLYVLVSAAAIPWLVAIAAWLWRGGAGGMIFSVTLFLLYVWTDFPINYAAFGMLPYLLAIPLGLVAVGAFVRFCESGRWITWLISTILMTAIVLVHFTSAMVVAPAAALIYLGASTNKEGPFSKPRHLAVWAIPELVILLNAFWWLPGIWLATTKGPSDFAFAHPEGVLTRLWQIVTTEAPIERVLWAGAFLGLPGFLGRGRLGAIGLLAFGAAGFAWGYLAGGFRALDFLQPGRHTFACYSALSIAAGVGIVASLEGLRKRFHWRLDLLVTIGFVSLGGWYFGADVVDRVRGAVLSPVPFLSSRPSPRLKWVFSRVKTHVRRGERLLYEEGGFGLKGVPDPFQGGRFSGLISDAFGIELIGGPYLHAALNTNFTQFGEGKLFERTNWDRTWFEKYARLYRLSAIVCWSPHARAFCKANPDLIEIKDDDGVVLIGRVNGFGGATIVGKAEVEATPGRLRVKGAEAGVDGTIVLRYHSVPCLRIRPPVAWDAVHQEDDPVPFIRLRPTPDTVDFELTFPPNTARGLAR